jgi:hypothetical protein
MTVLNLSRVSGASGVPGVFKVFCVFAMAASMLLSMLAPVPLGAATKAVPAQAGPKDTRQAQAALRLLMAAYVAGRQADMEALVSPAMIGYAGVVDAARQARPLQKQLRVTLSDLRAQASEDAGLVLVQARWEKRFVRLPAGVQVRKSGSAVFTLQRTDSGWKLSGLSGDNPFAAD